MGVYEYYDKEIERHEYRSWLKALAVTVLVVAAYLSSGIYWQF